MSRRSSTSPNLELELNLSPPSPNESRSNSNTSETSSEVSVEGSCVSSESVHGQYKSSKEITRSMMLVGCPRCLMYVMLSDEVDPKCPKCKSKVLLDVLNDQFTKTSGI